MGFIEKRQTMLFSATSTQKIEDLARLALKKEPIVVGVEDVVEKATVEGLEQGKRKGKKIHGYHLHLTFRLVPISRLRCLPC